MNAVPVTDTMLTREGFRAFSYGPRVEREGGHIEPPAMGERAQFYGIYKAGLHGGWEWVADARDAESARILAGIAQRSAPEPVDTLDVAYLAIGAKTALMQLCGGKVPEDLEGEMNYIASVVRHEETLNRVFREAMREHGEGSYSGVFCYDVAEEFGERFGTALLRGEPLDDGHAEILARSLIESGLIH